MSLNIAKIKNLSDVAEYWVDCLKKLDSKDDQVTAYDMVRIAASDNWHEWYNESEGDPLFVETFDLVADLETPIKRRQTREQMWRRVKSNVVALQKKYPA